MLRFRSNLCPVCGRPAITISQFIFLGPLKIINCGNCRSSIRLSPLIPFLVIAYSTFAFPIGAIILALQEKSFSGPIMMAFYFSVGGVMACVPAIIFMIFFGRLVVVEK